MPKSTCSSSTTCSLAVGRGSKWAVAVAAPLPRTFMAAKATRMATPHTTEARVARENAGVVEVDEADCCCMVDGSGMYSG